MSVEKKCREICFGKNFDIGNILQYENYFQCVRDNIVKAEMYCVKIASRVPDVSDFYEKCMSRMLDGNFRKHS